MISCTNNQKQLGVAYVVFAGDHDERLPYGEAGGGASWWHLVGPYMGGVPTVADPNGIVRCPAHAGPDIIFNHPRGSYAVPVSWWSPGVVEPSVSNNQRVFFKWFGAGVEEPPMRPFSMVPEPSTTALMTECAHDMNGEWGGLWLR